MSGIAHPLGHLLLRLNLHIHIPCARFDSTDKPSLCYLHSLYLAALLRQRRVLKRSLVRHHLSNPACRHKRHIRGKHIIDLLHRKVAAVKAYLRHLTPLQGCKNALKILIYYSCTDHNLIIKP